MARGNIKKVTTRVTKPKSSKPTTFTFKQYRLGIIKYGDPIIAQKNNSNKVVKEIGIKEKIRSKLMKDLMDHHLATDYMMVRLVGKFNSD